MKYQIKKLKKIRNFIGIPSNQGEPILINSMPKSGTNLIEAIVLESGYKRAPARCIVNDTLKWTFLSSRKGTFYLCHLSQSNFFKNKNFKSIYLERNMWECIRSYINYMYIDKNHKVSLFIRNSSNPGNAIHSLIFSNENPNKISLINEYKLFNEVDPDIYDFRINYADLLNKDYQTIVKLSEALSVKSFDMELALDRALKTDNPTKNKGKINIFNNINKDFEKNLKEKVESFLI